MIDVNNKFFVENREAIPKWLNEYKKGNNIDFKAVFSGNTLYYPGAYLDVEPINIFNQINLLHTYIYVDYNISKETVINSFNNDFIKDYRLYDLKEFTQNDLLITNWTPHYIMTLEERSFCSSHKEAFGLIGIFDRISDNHNIPNRICIIYLGSDAIAGYDALFQHYKEPLGLVLHDHSFGGNYNWFGKDGALHKIALYINKLPKFILCASNTINWNDYVRLYDASEIVGNQRHRYLSMLKKEMR